VVAGNANKAAVLDMLKQIFAGNGDSGDDQTGGSRTGGPSEDLREPPHHGSTTVLRQRSSQVGAPVVELYWEIPEGYDGQEFINLVERHVARLLREGLVGRGLADAVVVNRPLGCPNGKSSKCVRLTIVLTESENVDETVKAVLMEIKSIIAAILDGEKQSRTGIFDCCHDSFCGFDFFDRRPATPTTGTDRDSGLNGVAETLRKDPCVISILLPQASRSAY
jgi:hypothetical protein